MSKIILKDNWFYEYEADLEYRKNNNYELTDVRYILGKQLESTKKKALICIGINPSTAMPNNLDSTLKRVQKYAQESGESGKSSKNHYPSRSIIR